MNPKSLTDTELVAQCASTPGSRALLNELVQRFGPVVKRAIRWTLLRYGSAGCCQEPDVFQDVFVGLLRDGCRALGVEIVLDPVHASTMVDSFVVIHPEASCREVLRLGLAKALEGRGEFALALRYYEAYLKTAPSGPDRSAAVDRSAACVARAGLTESEGRFCTTQVSGSVIVKRP